MGNSRGAMTTIVSVMRSANKKECTSAKTDLSPASAIPLWNPNRGRYHWSLSIRPRSRVMRGPRAFRPCLLCGTGLIAILSLFAVSCIDSGRATPPPLPSSDQSEASSKERGPEDVPLLADEEREYIWDLEHHGNLLVKFGFKPMAEALARADRPALLQILGTSFIGQTLGNPREVRMKSEFGEAVRLEDSGSAAIDLTV